MKVRFNRWYNAVLTVLLSMLGFESCNPNGDGPVEYGAPHANYILKGMVTDEAGTPIQGIKITGPAPMVSSLLNQSVLTDASGAFELTEFTTYGEGRLTAEDIDGDANGGEFKSDTLYISTLPATKISEGDGWYMGKFEVNAAIKLKKK